MRKNVLLTLVAAMMLPVTPSRAEQANPRVTPVVRAYRKAQPAVVNIAAKRTRRVGFTMFGSDLFDDIFPSPFVRKVRSLGSGFIVHPKGYIVTNAHVVRRAESITVVLPDGTEYPAKVISADSETDLAVIKIPPPEDGTLAHLPLGRSDDLMVGETVIAIGNPLGYANSLTTGVISATDRTLQFGRDVEYTGLIQIDAPINPGNSGGPLLNVLGDVIGVNTAIRADAQNIGFAVPVDMLCRRFGELLDFERLNRTAFGAQVRARYGPDGWQLYVESVRANSPADGRLQRGDRLLELDGAPLTQIPDFYCPMLEKKPGQQVRLRLRRDDRETEVAVPIEARPLPDGRKLARELLGMGVRENTPEVARQLGLPTSRGLVIVGLDSGGPAERRGLRLKDVLIQVGNFYVENLEELGRVLESVTPGETVNIAVVRGNFLFELSVRTWGPPGQ